MTVKQKCCGNCEWWDEYNGCKDYGLCKYPLPFTIRRESTFNHQGETCPCFKEKEEK